MSGRTARVVVVDYDPEWPRVFAELRARILPLVEDLAVAVEHVGSTAVPGLAAKPVIDIDVIVPPGALAEAIERLREGGYEHRGNLGIEGREAFRAPGDRPRHHLYLCPEGSPALANHLAVRDHLRAHPDEVARYAGLKRRLAATFADDIDGYVEGKSAFLGEILRRCGFDDAAVEAIERQNRRPAAGTTNVRALWPLLHVRDIEASLAFYRDQLGFEVVGRAGAGGGLSWCRLERGGACLMLEQRPAPGNGDDPLSPHMELYFVCEDVEAIHRSLSASGLRPDPPKLAYYGMRQLFIEDPDGRSLCFEEPTSDWSG